MGEIVVQAFTTLDGVVQAGGGPDEDPEGGFPHGGWQAPYGGVEVGELIRGWEARTDALLLGRKTWENWAGHWGVLSEETGGLDGELTRRYNRVPKYVASRTRTELGWRGSHLLGPDVPAAVRALRQERSGEIRVWGSTRLVRTLAEHDLVDEYRLVTYPLVLGTGKRLFADGFPVTRLRLVDTRPLEDGIVVSTFRRASEA